jgi:hypothetical protein
MTNLRHDAFELPNHFQDGFIEKTLKFIEELEFNDEEMKILLMELCKCAGNGNITEYRAILRIINDDIEVKRFILH